MSALQTFLLAGMLFLVVGGFLAIFGGKISWTEIFYVALSVAGVTIAISVIAKLIV